MMIEYRYILEFYL